MTKTAAAFAVNDRIRHHVYGLGTISDVNPRHITIAFDENGTKKFLAEVVRLEHSDSPAPPRPKKTKAKAKKTK